MAEKYQQRGPIRGRKSGGREVREAGLRILPTVPTSTQARMATFSRRHPRPQ
jgi:hypothetical protein